ncbi:hypothetical protein ACFQS6_05055 [Xanthomonas populi]|uniref:Uncharacterized protein n=1 Tax=Xanthomonas populi TaxID=53414 RepID=A0A2S7EY30_9XANT|nr:hypothetical protein [Xanthomonas populi]PPU98055.1 hypothetical protein XpopCFBP1817_04535 [Xanthomonas populi]
MVTSDEDVSLGSTTTGNGTLRLTGPGARLAFWHLLVSDAGIGNMILQDGSQAATAGLMTLGKQGSTGNVLVTGAGSAELLIGRAGTDTLDITDGATVTTTRPYAVINPYGMSIGHGTTGTGTINVSNGGSLAITDNFLPVGTGTLNIGNGGKVNKVNADRGVHPGQQPHWQR